MITDATIPLSLSRFRFFFFLRDDSQYEYFSYFSFPSDKQASKPTKKRRRRSKTKDTVRATVGCNTIILCSMRQKRNKQDEGKLKASSPLLSFDDVPAERFRIKLKCFEHIFIRQTSGVENCLPRSLARVSRLIKGWESRKTSPLESSLTSESINYSLEPPRHETLRVKFEFILSVSLPAYKPKKLNPYTFRGGLFLPSNIAEPFSENHLQHIKHPSSPPPPSRQQQKAVITVKTIY